jgi:DNA-binding response OmpR family regulator
LVARARAALRRAEPDSAPEKPAIYSDGYLTIDLDERRVLVRGKAVRLTATEIDNLGFNLYRSDTPHGDTLN